MEFFVNNIQMYIPTIIIKFIVKIYIYITYIFTLKHDNINKVIKLKEHNMIDSVAVLTEKANEQHYEVPTTFFKKHLGKMLKYSSCEYLHNCNSIDDLELNTIKSYQKYLNLDKLNTGNILEMGCGWGSLSIYNAISYPNLNFTCFSNSSTQIEYINTIIKEKNIKNLVAIVEDYNIFCGDNSKIKNIKFDRVIAIETIEHCRNIKNIFKAVNIRLKDDGFVFIQSLVNQRSSYLMTNDTWMGRNFFSGGQILSIESYLHYNDDLIIDKLVPRNGTEYSKTLDLWLSNLECNKDVIIKEFGKSTYENFRLFYISSSEAFKSINGNNFMVCYYFLKKR